MLYRLIGYAQKKNIRLLLGMLGTLVHSLSSEPFYFCSGGSVSKEAALLSWQVMIGMTASEEYVRTARQIITKIQIEVNRVLTTGRLCEFLEDDGKDVFGNSVSFRRMVRRLWTIDRKMNTVSRRASFRRLHLTGCFVKASQCAEIRYVDEVNVDDFDTICRSCKKKMLDQCGKAPAESSTSTASIKVWSIAQSFGFSAIFEICDFCRVFFKFR